ncbi:hypothetical protein H0I23_14760 [Cellulophaga sp. HaHaR_3_176]|uniref:DUF6427 family protein n=1 Tax=Cellulophaga sp. HaHaR_3_176 TaxID=1942464 RepID=UPI001C1F7694|nr:DUF6427 family protein [Cellulophaga sp. HaHaR_3_176]QWX83697.1 hypothetical protein H0I23_14760 [Cellulophaga sp. HaHaR_3_176]
MISSIFGKTKPINYIIVLTFLFVFYFVAVFSLFSKLYEHENLIEEVITLATLIFSVFIINFIIKRNKITEPHSFTILFFTLLIVLFPEVLIDHNSVFCTFFMLLAIRRLVSIKSLKNIKLKLFDATLWVVISSLFYDWALLFIFLIFVTIYLYEPKNIRNWFVPIIGLLTVLIISLGVSTLLNQNDFLIKHYTFSINITLDFIYVWQNSIKLLLYAIATLTLIVLTFIKLSNSGQGRINTMRLITVYFVLGLVITLLKSSNAITPILLTFFPTSVFLSNYIETIKKPNIKEILLIALVLIPFLALLGRFI